jgi:hypothetical protein
MGGALHDLLHRLEFLDVRLRLVHGYVITGVGSIHDHRADALRVGLPFTELNMPAC